MTQVAKLVENALQQRPETRSNDKKLILAVWWQQNNNFKENFTRFFLETAYSPESITRCRRKFQEHGRYLPNDAVIKARTKRFNEMRQTAPFVDNPNQFNL